MTCVFVSCIYVDALTFGGEVKKLVVTSNLTNLTSQPYFFFISLLVLRNQVTNSNRTCQNPVNRFDCKNDLLGTFSLQACRHSPIMSKH